MVDVRIEMINFIYNVI